MSVRQGLKAVLAVLIMIVHYIPLAAQQSDEPPHRCVKYVIVWERGLDQSGMPAGPTLVRIEPRPTPAVQPTPSDPPRPAVSAASSRILRTVNLMNAERQKAGLAPLTINPNLERAAANYASTMARLDPKFQLSHTLGGTDPSTRARDAGYRFTAIGEDIAYNYPDAQSAVDGWMNSPPHRRNILNPQYQNVGVAIRANSRGELYWSVDFGRP